MLGKIRTDFLLLVLTTMELSQLQQTIIIRRLTTLDNVPLFQILRLIIAEVPHLSIEAAQTAQVLFTILSAGINRWLGHGAD